LLALLIFHAEPTPNQEVYRFFSAPISDNFVFNFNSIQFGTLTKMPRKDLSVAEKIALLDQSKAIRPVPVIVVWQR
jgi:hypothetical protein